jgi:hypothetical protein
MDDFLSRLYEEEREKIAAADLGGFMSTLPTTELEEFLGLTKVGVVGPDKPELPAGMAEKLNKEQSKVDSEVSKMQGEGPPDRNEEEEKKEASAARIRKIAMRKASSILEDPRYIAAVADEAHRKGDYLPKSSKLRQFRENPAKSRAALGVGGALMGGGMGAGIGRAVGGKKGAIAGALLGGAGLGAGGVALGGKSADLNRRIYAAMDKKEKKSQGFGEEDMGGAGGMETTASAKAEIVMRSMRVTEGAPPHIKRAAARFAGREIAKLAKADDKYSVKPGYLAGQKAQMRALSGRDAEQGAGILADPTLIGNRQIGGLKGGLLGGGLGAGIGTLAGGAASLLSRGRIRPDMGVLGGAAIGGLGGMAIGQTAGMYDADKRFLAERGIKPTALGLGRGRFTPEAAQKYLRPDELEGVQQ